MSSAPVTLEPISIPVFAGLSLCAGPAPTLLRPRQACALPGPLSALFYLRITCLRSGGAGGLTDGGWQVAALSALGALTPQTTDEGRDDSTT